MTEFERLCDEIDREYEAAAREVSQGLERLYREAEALPRSPGSIGPVLEMIDRLEALQELAESHGQKAASERAEAARRMIQDRTPAPRDYVALDAAAERYHQNELARMKVREVMGRELIRIMKRLYADRALLVALLDGGKEGTKH